MLASTLCCCELGTCVACKGCSLAGSCCSRIASPTVKKYFHFAMYTLFLIVTFVISYICLNPGVAKLLPKIPTILNPCQSPQNSSTQLLNPLNVNPLNANPLNTNTSLGETVVGWGEKIEESFLSKPSFICYGVTTVYRLGLACLMFFALHLLLSLIGVFYRGYYLVRWISFVALVVVTFFLPGDVLKVYAWASLPLAGIFILMLVMMLIDFAYQWQSSWIERERPIWFYLLVSLTVLFTVSSFILTVLEYVWMPCGLARGLISSNLILAVICYLLPLKLERATLFPISIIVLYNTYTVYGALSSGFRTNETCNYFAHRVDLDKNPVDATTIINTLFVLLSLVWTTFSLANSRSTFALSNTTSEDQYGYLESGLQNEDIEERNRDEDPNVDKDDKSRFRYFFFVVLLASCYMTAILSSWQVYGHSVSAQIDSSKVSMWIKMSTVWCCYLLFIWSTVAPKLFPNREF